MGKNQSRIKLIRESWRYIVEHCPKEFSETFYSKLFQDYPAYRYTIFKRIEGILGFSNLLLSVMNMLMTYLQPDKPSSKESSSETSSSSSDDNFKITVEELGRRHLHYGVDSDEYFHAFLAALLFSLERHLPKQMWTSEYKDAWNDGFILVMSMMLQGMRGVIHKQKNSQVNGASPSGSLRGSNRTLQKVKEDSFLFNFNKVWKHQQLRNLFIEYCYQRFTAEGCKFLVFMENFKEPALNNYDRWNILFYIWDSFIRNNAKSELNLPFDIRQKFLDRFEELKSKKSVSRDFPPLEDVEMHVRKTLVTNIFVEFVKSEEFLEAISVMSEKEVLELGGSNAIDGSATPLGEAAVGGGVDSNTGSNGFCCVKNNSKMLGNSSSSSDALDNMMEKSVKSSMKLVEQITRSCVEKELHERLPLLIHKKMETLVENQWFDDMLDGILGSMLSPPPTTTKTEQSVSQRNLEVSNLQNNSKINNENRK